MKFYFFIIGILCAQFGWAQTNEQGIYMSYEAFKNQKPYPYEIEVDSELVKEMYTYYLSVSDSLKQKKIARNIFGFTDGVHHYVVSPHAEIGDLEFCKIKISGTYCVFSDYAMNLTWSSFGAGKTDPSSVKSVEIIDYFIDPYEGKIYPLHSSTLKWHVMKDKALYKEFKKDKKRDDNILEYIKKLNELYAIENGK